MIYERTLSRLIMLGIALSVSCDRDKSSPTTQSNEEGISLPEHPEHLAITMPTLELAEELHSAALIVCTSLRDNYVVKTVSDLFRKVEAERAIDLLGSPQWKLFQQPIVIYADITEGADGIHRLFVHGLDITRTPCLVRVLLASSDGRVIDFKYDLDIKSKEQAYMFALCVDVNLVSWDVMWSLVNEKSMRGGEFNLKAPKRMPYCIDSGVYAIVAVENYVSFASNSVPVRLSIDTE